MSQFCPRTCPENPVNAQRRARRLSKLRDDIWALDKSFQIQFPDITMTGSVADVEAVGYLFYEQLLSPPLFADEQDVCLTTAMILGEFLVRHLGFGWCQSNVLPDAPCQVYRADDQLYLNLPSYIAHQWHMKGDMNLYFEHVIADIVVMHYLHSMEDHPMTALRHGIWDRDAYIRRFGYFPPEKVVTLFNRCYDQYGEDVFYELGTSVFELTCKDSEWQDIIRLLENMLEYRAALDADGVDGK